MPTRAIIIGFCCGVSLLAGGCPAPADSDAPLAAGAYWVEADTGVLRAFAMPKFRGETGQWHALTSAPATWYTGAALYELEPDDTWRRLTSDDSLCLDDLMQVWDPPPCVEDAAVTAF